MAIRTFVAIPVGRPWNDYLASVASDLSRLVIGVSWVKPGNFHMTLRFLGDLEESDVSRLGEAVARGAEGATAPSAELGGIGAFPSLERPRIIWIGLARGGDELLEVGSRVNSAIDAAGFTRADKPFRPHLTLGRVRDGARGVEALRDYAPPPAPPAAPLDRVLVMKSDLHHSGARYTAIREVRLPPQR